VSRQHNSRGIMCFYTCPKQIVGLCHCYCLLLRALGGRVETEFERSDNNKALFFFRSRDRDRFDIILPSFEFSVSGFIFTVLVFVCRQEK